MPFPARAHPAKTAQSCVNSAAVLAPSEPALKAHKGRKTRQAIVQAALRLAAQLGLDGLTIGNVAQAIGMSKSGVFAHFGSREDLQIAVVEAYHALFQTMVFVPALQAPRGLPRLRCLFQYWMQHTAVELDAGCLLMSSALEFDDKPGVVRAAVVHSLQTWLDGLATAVHMAVDAGHLRASTEAAQVVFELHGLMLALQIEVRLLQRLDAAARAVAGFDAVVARYAVGAK